MWYVLAVALAAFSTENTETAVTLLDDGKPVLTYNAEPRPDLKTIKGMQRACYIHPLYGLDGEVLTQDMPLDHLHHRGVFWAWPETLWGEKPLDLWLLKDIRTRTDDYSTTMVADKPWTLEFNNRWSYDETPDWEVVDEYGTVFVHPVEGNTRAVDFALHFKNISDQPLRFLGAEDKGYGGFNFRPDATKKPFTFYGDDGIYEEDQLKVATPWTAVTAEFAPGKTSGVAVFQHPANPGYPHDGWILRHYGFLGASWPHLEPFTLAPGETLTLRYRMVIFRGTPETAGIPALFQAYEAAPPPAE